VLVFAKIVKKVCGGDNGKIENGELYAKPSRSSSTQGYPSRTALKEYLHLLSSSSSVCHGTP
jgi:hypothetical protein